MRLQGVKTGENLVGYSLNMQDISAQVAKLTMFDDITDKHLRRAMQLSVFKLQAEIVPLVPTGVTGRLKGSIKSEVSGYGSNIVGKVGSTLEKEEYPAVMEFGRRPGKMPPPSALYRWVQIRLKVPKKKVPGVAYVIARSIARKGIKGRRFMQKGYRKSGAYIRQQFMLALDRITEDLSVGN